MEKKSKQTNNLAQLIEYNAEIRKDLKDTDKIIKIIQRMMEMKGSKIGIALKQLDSSKDKQLVELARNLITKWKKLIKKSKESANPTTTPTPSTKESPEQNKTSNPKPSSSNISVIDESQPAHRNSVKKMIFDALVKNVPIERQGKAKDIALAIEAKMFLVLKERPKYINRGKAIASNMLDIKNQEFKLNVLDGRIKPEELATMDVKDMLNKELKNEREQTEKDMFESKRSDWHDEHLEVGEGMYTCENCKGKKTTSKEIQMRGADEPMTLFIRCVDCGNEWKL